MARTATTRPGLARGAGRAATSRARHLHQAHALFGRREPPRMETGANHAAPSRLRRQGPRSSVTMRSRDRRRSSSAAPQLKLFELEPSGEDPFERERSPAVVQTLRPSPKPQRSTGSSARSGGRLQVLEKLAPATRARARAAPQTGGSPPSQMARMLKGAIADARSDASWLRGGVQLARSACRTTLTAPNWSRSRLKTSDVVAWHEVLTRAGASRSRCSRRRRSRNRNDYVEEQRMRRAEMTTMFKTKRVSSKGSLSRA